MKAKLPFGKKRDADDDEYEELEDESTSTHQGDATDATDISDLDVEEESDEENSSLVYKLKSKLASLSKKKKSKNDDDEDDEESDEDEEALKKKKKSKIIQIVIGGGLVVFLLSDYIFPPETPAPDPATLLKPRAKKEATPPAGETVTEPATDPTQPTEPATDVVTEPAAEPTPEPTEPATDVVTEPATEPTPEPISEPAVEPSTDIATEPTTPEEPSSDIAVDPIPETPSDETPDEPIFPDLDEPSDVVEQPNVSNRDSIDGDESVLTGEDNLTEQILLDLEKQAQGKKAPVQKKEYVTPPDYEYKGRGLVYNCTGKHWACVDAPSYKTCEDNSSSVKYLKKKTECYPFNVYETTKGCEDIQNRMVSSSAKTNFCND